MMNERSKYDFRAIGQAIKEARLKRGWTREDLAQEIDLAPRYIMSLENKGQHPSFQVFVDLITLFDISADQFLFPKKDNEKSTFRRQLDTTLDELEEKDYIILEATAKALQKVKETGE